MRQAELSARDGKTPVVVLHQDGRRYRDALAVCRLSEFAGLVGPPNAAGEKRGKHEGVTQR